MVEQVLGWVFSVLIVLYIPYMIYFNIVQAVARIKCRKKQYSIIFNPCHESNCKFSEYCEKYKHVYTADEIASLQKMISEKKD